MVVAKKINILQVVYSLNPGGTETVLVDLINSLDKDRFTNVVYTLTSNGSLGCKICDKNIKIYEGKKKKGIDLGLISKILKIIEEENIDIIHGRAWVSVIPCVLIRLFSKKRVKVIIGYHGQNYFEVDSKKRNFGRMLLQKFLLRYVDVLYTLNSGMRDYFSYQTGVNRDRFCIIPNGIDINLRNLNKNVEHIVQLRNELKINAEDLVVGFVGRLDKVKNLPTLCKAVKKAQDKYVHLKLLLVGSGPEESNLITLVNDLGISSSVVFSGWQDKPGAYYQLMDMYVQPSHFEGMSSALAQAMLYEIPAIASNVGGNPDLVENSRTGFLFEPDDVDGLLDKVCFLAADAQLRRRLGSQGKERITKEFSLATMVRRYEELYSGLISDNNGKV